MSPTKAVRQRLERILAVAAAEFPDARPLSLRDALEGKWQRSRQRDVITAYWQLAASLARLGGLLDSAASSLRRTSPGCSAAARKPRRLGEMRLISCVSRQPSTGHASPSSMTSTSWRKHSVAVRVTTCQFRRMFRMWAAIGRGTPSCSHPILRMVVRCRLRGCGRHRDWTPCCRFDTASCCRRQSCSMPETCRSRWPLTTSRNFAAAVMQYNLEIAEYAMLVAGEGVEGRRLIPMLIKEKQTEPPARESDDNTARRTSSPPSTFRNQGSSGLGDNPRLAERERRRDNRGSERSVLVDDPTSAAIDDDLRGLVPVRPPAPSDRWRSRSGRSEPGARVPQ